MTITTCTKPIPIQMREEMNQDLFYHRCIYYYLGREEECREMNRGMCKAYEWEHTSYYRGQRINHPKLIVPCCTYHHRGKGLDKEFNYYVALVRADIDELSRLYPKKNWRQDLAYLKKKYDNLIIRPIPICPLLQLSELRSPLSY